MARLSVELQRYFFEEDRQPQVKLADILSFAGERIFGFLFVILSLPSALPVPAPGYSIPFGIVGALGGHLLLGYNLSIISIMGLVADSRGILHCALHSTENTANPATIGP